MRVPPSAKVEPGDRIEIVLASGDVLSRGVYVGHFGWDHSVLLDPNEGAPNGQPASYRADQIRPERGWEQAFDDALTVTGEAIDLARMEFEKPSVFGWNPARSTAIADVLKALKAERKLLRREERKVVAPNCGEEILYETSDGLRANERCEVITEYPGNPVVQNCTFFCELRGWRYFCYPSGGMTALRGARVRPVTKPPVSSSVFREWTPIEEITIGEKALFWVEFPGDLVGPVFGQWTVEPLGRTWVDPGNGGMKWSGEGVKWFARVKPPKRSGK
jgi:hypothetical protein